MPNERINPYGAGNAPDIANALGIVQGIATGDDSVKNGVFGSSVSGDGVDGRSVKGYGVRAESKEATGLYAKGSQAAARFDGDITVNGKSSVNGELHVKHDVHVEANINVKGDISLVNADLAEDFDVLEFEDAAPGCVMVLDNSGRLRRCDRPRDTRVAGVVSGSGTYKPGIILDRTVSKESRVPIAMIGKVYCFVDAQYGAITAGDLLTTSATKGAAMKVSNPVNAVGAIIGKAMRPWSHGVGQIPIVVTLK